MDSYNWQNVHPLCSDCLDSAFLVGGWCELSPLYSLSSVIYMTFLPGGAQIS